MIALSLSVPINKLSNCNDCISDCSFIISISRSSVNVPASAGPAPRNSWPMPMAPDQYDADTFVRILRDLEMALTKIDFPAVVSGEDDDNGKNWFMD